MCAPLSVPLIVQLCFEISSQSPLCWVTSSLNRQKICTFFLIEVSQHHQWQDSRHQHPNTDGLRLCTYNLSKLILLFNTPCLKHPTSHYHRARSSWCDPCTEYVHINHYIRELFSCEIHPMLQTDQQIN